jgi:hypothetical protein
VASSRDGVMRAIRRRVGGAKIVTSAQESVQPLGSLAHTVAVFFDAEDAEGAENYTALLVVLCVLCVLCVKKHALEQSKSSKGRDNQCTALM